MNTELIPYVPLSPRVQSKNRELVGICIQFFEIVDRSVCLSVKINHLQARGELAICPDQINDLADQVQQKRLDIDKLRQALESLIYPVFKGEKNIISPIWNNQEITVWEFQLNHIDRTLCMKTTYTDASQYLDSTLGALRIWRNSLQTGLDNPDVTFKVNDLVHFLQDLELKLEKVQDYVEETE
ncbi:hypothetical protein [Acinetobacter sp. A47]|uniref:hypothetical protein n=1 Tax=Acinetobacter sp. A47 TaxID=1561217 RepID=UPI00057186FE|nr:hypothetical protein [Acinetobacter sp. A47]